MRDKPKTATGVMFEGHAWPSISDVLKQERDDALEKAAQLADHQSRVGWRDELMGEAFAELAASIRELKQT